MNESGAVQTRHGQPGHNAPAGAPSDWKATAARDIAAAMNAFLADTFALYLKTKNFHWHMTSAELRHFHLLLDEQARQIFAMTDPIAERIRKLGRSTLMSIGHIARTQRVLDNDAEYLEPMDMLVELREDNRMLAERFREAHNACYVHHDTATADMIKVWIDEAERRTRLLFEATGQREAAGD